MRTSHIYLSLVAIATFGAIAAAPVSAQITDGAMPFEVTMSPEQLIEFETWPAEQKAAYELWPSATKSYYWTLPPERQMLFWRLSDDDKTALTAMTGTDRDTAWGQIEGSLSSPPPER